MGILLRIRTKLLGDSILWGGMLRGVTGESGASLWAVLG